MGIVILVTASTVVDLSTEKSTQKGTTIVVIHQSGPINLRVTSLFIKDESQQIVLFLLISKPTEPLFKPLKRT